MSTSNAQIHNCDKCKHPILPVRGGLRFVIVEAEWVGGVNGVFVGYQDQSPPATPVGEPFTYPPPNTGYPCRDDDPPSPPRQVRGGKELTFCRDCLAKTLGFATDKETDESRKIRVAYYDQLMAK